MNIVSARKYGRQLNQIVQDEDYSILEVQELIQKGADLEIENLKLQLRRKEKQLQDTYIFHVGLIQFHFFLVSKSHFFLHPCRCQKSIIILKKMDLDRIYCYKYCYHVHFNTWIGEPRRENMLNWITLCTSRKKIYNTYKIYVVHCDNMWIRISYAISPWRISSVVYVLPIQK